MKMPTPRFLYILTAITILLSASGLRADTVVTDPRGGTLCFGKSTVKVDFGRANFDAELSKLHDAECLVMGVIDGRVVVANLNQTASGPTQNKLFFVGLLGDGKASFSGLISDRINVTGSMALKQFVKTEEQNLGARGYIPIPIRIIRGQLLPWKGKKPDGTPTQYILMTDQYQKGISVFEYRSENTAGEVTGIMEIHFVRNMLLPGKFTDYNVNVLDAINLNAFRDTENVTEYQPALMVWCKPNFRTGYNNTQLVAPTDLLCCLVDDAVTQITINSEDHFNYKPYTEGGSESENMLTGFITAPNDDGKLCYWGCKVSADIGFFDTPIRSEVHVMPIVFSQKGIMTRPSTVKCVWNDDDGRRYDSLAQRWSKWYSSNPGLRILFKKRQDNEVGMTPALMPDIEPYEVGNDRIGVCDTAAQAEVDQINAKIRIAGGAIPSNPTDRLKRLAQVEGWTVLRVFLGQPYVAAPKLTPTDPVKPKMIYKDCYISYKYDKSSLYQYAFNNGTSESLSIGVSGKKTAGFAKFDAGVKSTYEYKYNKATNAEVSIGVETEQRASGASSFDQGTIVYTSVKPIISSISRIVPQKGAKNLTVEGDPKGTFSMLMINASPQQNIDSKVVSFQNFLCSNPAVTSEGADGTGKTYIDAADGEGKSLSFKTPYSVFSDGLVPRTVSSLIECNQAYDDMSVDAARNLIWGWQSSNNIIVDIQQFNSNEGGVSAYFGKVENGQMTPLRDGSVNTGFNQSAAFSIIHETETKVTRSHQGTVGFYWNLDFVGLFNTKGEVNYKGGREELNTDSEKHKFEVSMGGWDGAPNYKRAYYYYWIDVPSMKSYMASHTYTLQAGENKGTYTNEVHRPGFIPAYCWVNDQSFMLGVPWLKTGVNATREGHSPSQKKSKKPLQAATAG
jgi:hypothetical protein